MGRFAFTPSSQDRPTGMKPEAFAHTMARYIPENSIETVYNWIAPHGILLKITKPRTSKLGDFKIPTHNSKAAISVNGNLNPYAFLITLTHEVAHLFDYKQRQTLRDAHGSNWKNIYSQLLEELLNLNVFPESLKPALWRHIQNPKAASCSDPMLLDALRAYDEKASILLKEVDEGALFALTNGRVFRKGTLRRTRYKCLEIQSNRWFLVHAEAEIIPVDAENLTSQVSLN